MIFLLKLPVLHDRWFLALALVCSIFLAARGIAIEWPHVKSGQIKPRWLYCFQPLIYNFFGSLAGWVALYALSYRILTAQCPTAPPPGYFLDWPNLHLLGWSDFGLAAVAFLGVTGKLPETVQAFIIAIAGLVKLITDKFTKS
jgi:hypothetical protein